MEGIMMAIQMILALCILVLIHEAGHFVFARLFGVRVEKFYIFFDAFGISLWKTHWKGTEFGIGWLPLGGYVRIAGMLDESFSASDLAESTSPEERKHLYIFRPAWQRLLILSGGILFNILFALLFLPILVRVYDRAYTPLEALLPEGLYVYEAGQKLGLQTGDLILRINGRPIRTLEELLSRGMWLVSSYTVLRDGKEIFLPIPDTIFLPTYVQTHGPLFRPYRYLVVVIDTLKGSPAVRAGILPGDTIVRIQNQPVWETAVDRRGFQDFAPGDTLWMEVRRNGTTRYITVVLPEDRKIGIQYFITYPYPRQPYTWAEAFQEGWKRFLATTQGFFAGLIALVQGQVSLAEGIQSPVAIATLYGGEFDWERFWRLTVLLSLVLAFVNLLPIPALDGGHILFTLVEILTGYRPSARLYQWITLAGALILIALMVFAVVKDIIWLTREESFP